MVLKVCQKKKKVLKTHSEDSGEHRLEWDETELKAVQQKHDHWGLVYKAYSSHLIWCISALDFIR